MGFITMLSFPPRLALRWWPADLSPFLLAMILTAVYNSDDGYTVVLNEQTKVNEFSILEENIGNKRGNKKAYF